MYAPPDRTPLWYGAGSRLERYTLVNAATFGIDPIWSQPACGVAHPRESLPSPITGRGGAW